MAESDQATDRDDEQADSGGGDSAEGKAEQREERDPPAGGDDDSGSDDGGDDEESGEGQSEEHEKAQKKEEETQAAREKIKEMEEGEPPQDLADWPDDAAKYETFGGPEGEHGYHEGPEEEKLGPSSLRHHEDGGVSIAGEAVDDPDQYKGEPIPGGPTDPEAGQDLTTEKIREKQGRDLESEDEEDGDSDSEDSDSKDSDSDSESEES